MFLVQLRSLSYYTQPVPIIRCLRSRNLCLSPTNLFSLGEHGWIVYLRHSPAQGYRFPVVFGEIIEVDHDLAFVLSLYFVQHKRMAFGEDVVHLHFGLDFWVFDSHHLTILEALACFDLKVDLEIYYSEDSEI